MIPPSRSRAAVAPDLLRITAGNAGPLTATGTNTYVLGSGRAVVIDPGPADPQHLDAILAALAGRDLEAIIVTHAHADHSGLAPALAAATGAPVMARGPAGTGQSAAMAALQREGLRTGGEGLDTGFRCDVALAEGMALQVAGDALTVIHTPGHCGNHICLAWRGHLFSGDHVMGWSTSVVIPPDGDMDDYMASLDRLAGGHWTSALPGHGAAIPDPAARIAALIRHRRAREAAIFAALSPRPRGVPELTALAWPGLDPVLVPAAELSCLAHLLALVGAGRAHRTGLRGGLPEFWRE